MKFFEKTKFQRFFSKTPNFLSVLKTISLSLSLSFRMLNIVPGGCMLTKKNHAASPGRCPCTPSGARLQRFRPGLKTHAINQMRSQRSDRHESTNGCNCKTPPSKGREESCNCNLPPMPATEWWATYTVTAGIWTGAQSICYLAGHPSYRRSDHWATSTAENFNVGNWIWILC